MKKHRSKSPRYKEPPPERKQEVRAKEDPENFDRQTPAWQFNQIDKDHALWGFSQLSHEKLLNLIQQNLSNFETMTWAQIKSASGGKGEGKGTNHHNCPLEGFCTDAQKRLRELRNEDVSDELFSLRINAGTRLYGLKDGRIVKFIWYDPHHKTKNAAYPIKENR